MKLSTILIVCMLFHLNISLFASEPTNEIMNSILYCNSPSGFLVEQGITLAQLSSLIQDNGSRISWEHFNSTNEIILTAIKMDNLTKKEEEIKFQFKVSINGAVSSLILTRALYKGSLLNQEELFNSISILANQILSKINQDKKSQTALKIATVYSSWKGSYSGSLWENGNRDNDKEVITINIIELYDPEDAPSTPGVYFDKRDVVAKGELVYDGETYPLYAHIMGDSVYADAGWAMRELSFSILGIHKDNLFVGNFKYKKTKEYPIIGKVETNYVGEFKISKGKNNED